MQSKIDLMNREWVLPSVLLFSALTGPTTLQLAVWIYLLYWATIELPKELDKRYPMIPGQPVYQRTLKKILKVCAWIAVVGLAWLAITIAINVIWPTPVAPDFLWPESN